MGKGSNVNKKRAAQANAAKRQKEEKKGGGGKAGMKQRAEFAEKVQCDKCKVKFPSWKAKGQIKAHYENKHGGEDMEKIFPGITQAWGL